MIVVAGGLLNLFHIFFESRIKRWQNVYKTPHHCVLHSNFLTWHALFPKNATAPHLFLLNQRLTSKSVDPL